MTEINTIEPHGGYYCTCNQSPSYEGVFFNVPYMYSIVDKLIRIWGHDAYVANCTLMRCSDVGKKIEDISISDALVKITAGSLYVVGRSLICGAVKVKNGNITIFDSTVYGDIFCQKGNVLISSTKNSFDNACMGIPWCVIYGNVRVDLGCAIISGANVYGTLTLTSNKITIGKGAFIQHLKMKCVRPHMLLPHHRGVYRGPYSKGDIALIEQSPNTKQEHHSVKPTEGGADEYVDHRQTLRITQFITLEAGARLQQLDFLGDWCVLTLEENAWYDGDIPPNLEIIFP